jgi:predicted nucleotidyltransferase
MCGVWSELNKKQEVFLMYLREEKSQSEISIILEIDQSKNDIQTGELIQDLIEVSKYKVGVLNS